MQGKVNKIKEGQNFTAVSIGKLADLLSFSLGDSKGKIFLKEDIKSTGSEISFQLLPAGTELPFFHSHKQNEEIYIVLKGKGKMQIDDNVFDLSEGSIVRVAPKGHRSLKSADDSDMTYMVVQAKENSLTQWTGTDGALEETVSLLKK